MKLRNIDTVFLFDLMKECTFICNYSRNQLSSSFFNCIGYLFVSVMIDIDDLHFNLHYDCLFLNTLIDKYLI